MLLSLMRKHAQSWIIKFMIGLIVVVFVFFYGYSYMRDEVVKVAEVNDEPISTLEYDKARRNMLNNIQQQYKNVSSDILAKAFDIKNRALEALIEQKIISQEAERLGFIVTKKEIREKILELFPVFIIDGEFDENSYRQYLESNYTSSKEYEEGLSNDLLRQKIAQFLMTFLVPSDQEILDSYQYENEKIKLGFVKFSPDEYKSSVEKEREAINAFFEERKENYRMGEKRKIGYIKINPDMFKDGIELDENEVMRAYEDNISMYAQEKQVRARHILFKVTPGTSPEDQEKIKERAASALERVKKGEDFAELAKLLSEGPSNKNGGDLGFFKRGKMIKEFEDIAFSLKKGDISDLVKTSEGYHIIKVEDIKEETVKPYTEVRDQIESSLIQDESMDLAKEKAQNLRDQIYDVDLKEFATEHEVPYYITDFFSKSAPTPVINGDSKLNETLFVLEKGDVTEVVPLNNEFFIFQVVDIKDSYLPELDEVYVAVEVDYIDHMALETAKAEAEKYLNELKEGSKWEELAKDKNKTIESTNFFTRRSPPGKIGTVADLQEVTFKLNAENPFPDRIFDNNKGAFVVKWEGKQDIDETKYNEEKDRFAESLTMKKQNEVFGDWIEKVKEKSDIDLSYFEKIN